DAGGAARVRPAHLCGGRPGGARPAPAATLASQGGRRPPIGRRRATARDRYAPEAAAAAGTRCFGRRPAADGHAMTLRPGQSRSPTTTSRRTRLVSRTTTTDTFLPTVRPLRTSK